jgi:hypothetical protein
MLHFYYFLFIYYFSGLTSSTISCPYTCSHLHQSSGNSLHSNSHCLLLSFICKACVTFLQSTTSILFSKGHSHTQSYINMYEILICVCQIKINIIRNVYVHVARFACKFSNPSVFSFRWLVSQGKLNKALCILKKFEKINGTKVEPRIYTKFSVSDS